MMTQRLYHHSPTRYLSPCLLLCLCCSFSSGPGKQKNTGNSLLFCALITDAGLAHLRPLSQLQDLNLAGCALITDAGVAQLSSLSRLQRLDVSDCDLITEAGVAQLSAALPQLKFR
jgi:hypothetical protein